MATILPLLLLVGQPPVVRCVIVAGTCCGSFLEKEFHVQQHLQCLCHCYHYAYYHSDYHYYYEDYHYNYY